MLERGRWHRDIFGERAGAGHADHWHAWLERGDVVGNGIDDAGKLRARHEWQRVLGLIKALHLQSVDEADRRGADLDADFAVGNAGRIDLLDRDAVDRVVAVDNYGLHAISFMRFLLGLQCITPAS